MKYELLVTLIFYICLALITSLLIYFLKIRKKAEPKGEEIKIIRFLPGVYLFFLIFNIFLTLIIISSSIFYWLLGIKAPFGMITYIILMVILNIQLLFLNVYCLTYKIVLYKDHFKVYRFLIFNKEFKYKDVTLFQEKYGFHRVIKNKLPILNLKNIENIEFLEEMIAKAKENGEY